MVKSSNIFLYLDLKYVKLIFNAKNILIVALIFCFSGTQNQQNVFYRDGIQSDTLENDRVQSLKSHFQVFTKN
jgi:hypothetical protein